MSRYALPLPGYDAYSVWGWDDGLGTWFLQIWPNEGNPDEEPPVWLYGLDRPLYPLELARGVGAQLGVDPLDVLLAMELGGRGWGWQEDAYGDVGTVPRLAEAIAIERGLEPGDVLDAMEGEEGLDYHYFGGWEKGPRRRN